MEPYDEDNNPQGLRVIKTARDEDSINKAALNGFMPLLKKVEPSKKIRSKYCVIQNKTTGEIEVIGDYRMDYRSNEHKTVIDWTTYYPYSFPSPFAAYLIPGDITIGERVFIEDLIEDYIGESWNQGDTYRLEGCEAIWTGSGFKIQYKPEEKRRYSVG
jgi:hypothetical protein